jgi:hypothetical protein
MPSVIASFRSRDIAQKTPYFLMAASQHERGPDLFMNALPPESYRVGPGAWLYFWTSDAANESVNAGPREHNAAG